jgi:hypothetical protein
LSGSGLFFGRGEDSIGAAVACAGTASMLANRRHLKAVDVRRGTAARVLDMAVDMSAVGCRECQMSRLKIVGTGAY